MSDRSRGTDERGRGRGRGGRGDQGFGGGRGGGRGGGSFSGFGRGGEDNRGGRGRGDVRGGRGGRGGGGRPEATIFVPEGSTGVPPPSAAVRKVEDGIIAAQKGLSGLSLDSLSLAPGTIILPPRPGYATKGTPITLRTNFFHFQSTTKSPLYRYNVEISPDEKQRRKRRRLFQLLWDTPRFLPISDRVASDMGSTIISAERLDFGVDDREKISITYYDDDQPGPRQGAKVYELAIQMTGTLQVEDLIDYLSNTSASASLDAQEEMVQALNIVMAKHVNASPGIVPLGTNKYFVLEDNPIPLGGGLIALRGYYSSIRPSNARVVLNLNICNSPFYSAVKLSTLITEFLRGSPKPWPNGLLVKLRTFLKGLKVVINYSKDSGRVKMIIGLGSGQGLGRGAREVTFKTADGSTVSVEAWFKRQYNIDLNWPGLPVVNLGDRARAVYVPPELCTVVQGQPYKAKLSEEQTTKMINTACRDPATNARCITREGCEVVGIAGGSQQQGWMAPFGITVDPSMLTVDGRVLAAPKVSYQSSTLATATTLVTASNGSWNMKDIKFTTGANLFSWACINLRSANPRDENHIGPNLNNYLDTFEGVLKRCGITTGIRHPSLEVELPGTGELDNAKVIGDAMKHFINMKAEDNPPKILLIILPNSDKVTYAKIKYFGDTKAGIHTVCALAKMFAKHDTRNYLPNIALKFNLKCGGVNQTISPDKLGPTLKDGKTMLVGIDVTHPSPSSVKGVPSIAGIVASIDGQFAQWPGSIVLQESKKEMVIALKEMMVQRLELWAKKNNNELPKRIIIYRDGVGESQYQKILKEELPPVREAIQKVYGKRPAANLAIVVVGKRHHTRFYPVDKSSSDNITGNPKPGTVVDRGITGVRYWDFYLQAHAGVKGTARPAHYVVILDEIGLGADGIEQMTHTLCYLYGRATKSVSICPPAYYADLLCERGRCYIHSLLNQENSVAGAEDPAKVFERATNLWGGGVMESLKDSMFYI